MAFRGSDKFRLHKEDLQRMQHVEHDDEYHKEAWWAFKWFLIGGFSSAAVLELLRVVVHMWRW